MGDTRKSSVTFFLKKLAHAAYIYEEGDMAWECGCIWAENL